jgi:hypothetical protein
MCMAMRQRHAWPELLYHVVRSTANATPAVPYPHCPPTMEAGGEMVVHHHSSSQAEGQVCTPTHSASLGLWWHSITSIPDMHT